MKDHSLDTADRIVRGLEAVGIRLEPRGEKIWISHKMQDGEDLRQELLTHRDEVLRYLRIRAYDRLTASARTLERFLDGEDQNPAIREIRLPEYRELLDQISQLQPYVDGYKRDAM